MEEKRRKDGDLGACPQKNFKDHALCPLEHWKMPFQNTGQKLLSSFTFVPGRKQDIATLN